MKKTTKKLGLEATTIHVLGSDHLQRVGGAWTNTCLGTDCQCGPTYGPGTECYTRGYSQCLCGTMYNTGCGC